MQFGKFVHLKLRLLLRTSEKIEKHKNLKNNLFLICWVFERLLVVSKKSSTLRKQIQLQNNFILWK